PFAALGAVGGDLVIAGGAHRHGLDRAGVGEVVGRGGRKLRHGCELSEDGSRIAPLVAGTSGSGAAFAQPSSAPARSNSAISGARPCALRRQRPRPRALIGWRTCERLTVRTRL